MAETYYMTAVRNQQAAKSEDSAAQRALQWLSLEQQQIAQRQAQQQQQEKLAAKQWELNQKMQAPQSPAPGQASVPMQAPAPGGAPQQQSPMGAPAGGMQAMMAGAPPGGAAPQGAPPAPAPQQAMAQQPTPWITAKSAPQHLGGQPPAPMGGMGPQSPTGSPTASMPAGPPGGVEMPKLQSFDQLFEQVQKMPGLSDSEREHVLEAGAVQMDKQNKEKLEAWKLTQSVQMATKKAAQQAAEDAIVEKLHLPAGTKLPPETVNAIVAAKGDLNKVADIVGKIEAKKGAFKGGGGGGVGAGGGGPAGDFGAKYAKMSPIEQEKLDEQSWANIKTGAVPYRKGAGGGNDKNDLMYNNKARIALGLGMSAEELAAKPAEFKATAQSLTQVTKDLSAIEPFKDMLDKNVGIAKELAKKAIATNSQFANKTINWLRQNASDNPSVSEYLAQIRIVQTEAARVLNNPRLVGQLTDSARHEMEGVVNGDMPLNSTNAVLDRLMSDGTNRVAAMQKKEAQLRGKLEGKSESTASAPSSGDIPAGWTVKEH